MTLKQWEANGWLKPHKTSQSSKARAAKGSSQAMKTIKDLPEHSRPREKLREQGVSALTDDELVAAILGMGTAGLDVRTIARQVAGLIREHKEKLTLDHLLDVPGMGLAKAAQILLASASSTTSSSLAKATSVFRRPDLFVKCRL